MVYTKLLILWNLFRLKRLHVEHGNRVRLRGHIGLQIGGGKMTIGNDFQVSSGTMSNAMGRNIKSCIRVGKNGVLTIGNNVGMSSMTLWCNDSITIGNNVKVGAMTIITDNDAHAMDPVLRANPKTDAINAKHAPVVIKDNAFIGAMCFIGKGVTIGENSIVGAGSVVTKSIPDNEIWAGNPAKFIKKLEL